MLCGDGPGYDAPARFDDIVILALYNVSPLGHGKTRIIVQVKRNIPKRNTTPLPLIFDTYSAPRSRSRVPNWNTPAQKHTTGWRCGKRFHFLPAVPRQRKWPA